MSKLDKLSNKRLAKLIAETQQSLNELKQEVERREKQQQEYELAELDHHMENAELSLATIRDFINYLLEKSKKV